MSEAHAPLPPSGAKAWRHCAMWPHMNAAYPQNDTPESAEGTAAHWVAWEMQAGRGVLEGAAAPNGVIVTAEMLDGAELLVDTIAARCGTAGFSPPSALLGPFIEQRVDCPAVHPECWGTPDAWLYDPATWTLEIIDYKFGHRFVDEYENDQCVTYYAGIVDVLAQHLRHPVGEFDAHLTVNITIVQPRCFYRGAPVRTWTTKGSDLRAQINALRNAAHLARPVPSDGRTPTATTNDGCIDCPGRHACPALQQAAYWAAEIAVQSAPHELPPAAASLELHTLEQALARLQARVDGLTEAVSAYGRQGLPIPFHVLESNPGRAKWSVPVNDVINMGAMMGVNLAKPGVLTPTQARKAGVDAAVISAYSVSQQGAAKLQPHNPASARRVFG